MTCSDFGASLAGVHVWAANGMGTIECLDLRMNKMQGSLKGSGGAVKSLALHPELPIIASVGLDRFLRVHNTDSKALLCKLYLKQHLTAVAWSTVHAQTAAAGADSAEAGNAADATADEAVELSKTQEGRKSSSKRAGSMKKGKSHRKKQKSKAQI